ncbi:inositol monophosphatase family protein [Paracoccus sp. SCSIO 75233]|uniref:inositol monophosphatase family protein n=1 Tax=Paracoccus sp. SCSIO 75233 TaxID=3017782 RepID=UPI0022F0E244|nr:inositol monophosphatase family protein [Paracoccus sp. SCSIO 75233]WBU53031.1 hypothetical protein PAF12_14640 [Paracoccus sp. SCSIO 75233]
MDFNCAQIRQIADMLNDIGELELIPRFRAKLPNRAFEKTASLDDFCEAIQTAEQRLYDGLARLFSGAAVVGEETSAALKHSGQADIAFLFDPIYGTKKITSGLPLFEATIAGSRRVEIVLAAIDDSVCNEIALTLRREDSWIAAPNGSSAMKSSRNFLAGTAPPSLKA